MTDRTAEKGALNAAILRYVDARRKDGWDAVDAAQRASQEIEDAITALDNAAYDRAYSQALLWNDDKRQELWQVKQELDQAERRRVREASEADTLLKERDAARAALASASATIWRLGYGDGERSRLRKALETLADRYHAQMCYRPPRMGHRRQTCPQLPLAVQDAERALAGESEVPYFSGKITNGIVMGRALSPEEVDDYA